MEYIVSTTLAFTITFFMGVTFGIFFPLRHSKPTITKNYRKGKFR